MLGIHYKHVNGHLPRGLHAMLMDEGAAYQLLKDIRFQGCFRCPRCSSSDYEPPEEPYVEGAERYYCRYCNKSFDALTGTTFQRSKIPLNIWFQIIVMMKENPDITSYEVSKHVKLKSTTAWSMMFKLRRAMIHGGDYVIDEIYRRIKERGL